MPEEPKAAPLTDAEKMRLLPWSVASSATNAVFAVYTVFGSVFVLFLDRLGLNKTQIGTVQSLLPFAGLIAPLVAPAVGRAGLKRAFLLFWLIRKYVIALLLLAPWVQAAFGPETTFAYVSGILLAFAVCRAVAETAWYPWNQEVVPDSVRGRFTAVVSIVNTLSMALAVAVGSVVLQRCAAGFQLLIAVGVIFGAAGVWCALFVPGGGPLRLEARPSAHLRGLRAALRDRNFLRYLLGMGLLTLGTGPLTTFVPLLAKEQMGLAREHVVLLDGAALVGGLAAGYFCGRWADRGRSRRVMLGGMLLSAALTLCWLIAPRHSPASFQAALLIAFVGGIAGLAWQIGSQRIYYVCVVPDEKKTQYMSIYYAWMGLAGGVGPLAAGAALDYCRLIAPQPLRQQPYAPVFAACCLLILAGAIALRNIRDQPAPAA